MKNGRSLLAGASLRERAGRQGVGFSPSVAGIAMWRREGGSFHHSYSNTEYSFNEYYNF
jgi:hypothetical protein